METNLKSFKDCIRHAVVRKNGEIINPSAEGKGRRLPLDTGIREGDIVLVCGGGDGYPYDVTSYQWGKDVFGVWGFQSSPNPLRSNDPRWVEATREW